MPDRRTVGHAGWDHPDTWNVNDSGIQSDLSSLGAHAAEGCMNGMVVDLQGSVVTTGDAWHNGNRIRVREPAPIDLAGVARPPSGQFAWVSVLVVHAQLRVGEVRDRDGITHDQEILDSSTITLARGTNSSSSASAVRPSVPQAALVLGDVLLDSDTAVSSLTLDDSRRSKCPQDLVNDDIQIFRQEVDGIRALLAAEVARRLAPPDAPAAPSLSSLRSFRITAAWTPPASEGGSPVDQYRLRWRRKGSQWSPGNVLVVGLVLTAEFSVPDIESSIEVQVSAHSLNGWGGWSPISEIAPQPPGPDPDPDPPDPTPDPDPVDPEPVGPDPVDPAPVPEPDPKPKPFIRRDPPLRSARFTRSTSYTWPYRLTSKCRVDIRGGSGGGGRRGSSGSRGTDATLTRIPGRTTKKETLIRSVDHAQGADLSGVVVSCPGGTIEKRTTELSDFQKEIAAVFASFRGIDPATHKTSWYCITTEKEPDQNVWSDGGRGASGSSPVLLVQVDVPL